MDVKLSEAWIRSRFDPGCSRDDMINMLTSAGLTVELTEPVASDFDQVIVAKIDTVRPHPNADKLRLCDVNDGEHTHQVVCGAPNVVSGLHVAFAKVGAVLPDIKIKQVKIRGEASSGMICSAAELGVGTDHEGILELPDAAPVGEDFRKYLELDDRSLLIDLTPNRADCLSVEGLARELAVSTGQKLIPVEIPAIPPVIDECFPVELGDSDACPRYVGRIIRNVNVRVNTPLWLKERLRRSGIRSVDPVVDVTNYVLREFGQPMHAFDLDKLKDGICVRYARPGESVELLNKQCPSLTADTLLITDATGPIAIAGVMGGLSTSIRTTGDSVTQNIFLESAYFNPLAIVGRSRAYGLTTDAAGCYERGVDYCLQVAAMERASALLVEIAGGEPGPLVMTEASDALPVRKPIELRAKTLKRLLGIELPMKEVADYFDRLGFNLESPSGGASDRLSVRPPSWRFDIEQEADLVEEVARLYGYDQLPMEPMRFAPSLNTQQPSATGAKRRLVADRLVSLGYQESMNYSFISESECAAYTPDAPPVLLQNPSITGREAMRTSILPGLAGTMVYNLNRQQKHLRLFESGLVFAHDAKANNGIRQTPKVAGLCLGEASESWHDVPPPDFFSIKGDLEALFYSAGIAPSWRKLSDHPALHPNQSAQLWLDGACIGICGRMHPRLLRQASPNHPANADVYMFELNAEIFTHPHQLSFVPISSHPSLRRDLAIVVAETVPAADILASVRDVAGNHLVELVLFDLYTGKGVSYGMKSLALGLTFQAEDKNLLESELEPIIAKIIRALKRDFAVTFRV